MPMEYKDKVPLEGNGSVVETKIAPTSFYVACFMVSLTLPNLIFSGPGWFDTLHLMKWVMTMVPITMIAIVVGWRLLVSPAKDIKFRMDPFGWVWLVLLIFFTAQPLWAPIKATATFIKEWFFFATLFAAYIFAYNQFPPKLHRWILWGASLNAAINVVFAEIMTRVPESPAFFIMNVPGHYIGNTGQQEMFGLWMAMAVFNSVFLHIRYGLAEEKTAQGKTLVWINLLLLVINSWGLWNSTARGGILSLILGFSIVVLMMWRKKDYAPLKRALAVFSVVVVLLVITLSIGGMMSTGRSSALVLKTMNMVQNPTAMGDRATIWRTSWTMFKEYPITGVGLGQYKWNYLDAQGIILASDPKFMWQFTYWAHSEYLQWLAETGIFGALILGCLGFWWLYCFVKAVIKRTPLSNEAIWGCGMLFLLWFDAIFSRPFHRIENVLWMSIAFALANKELLPRQVFWSKVENPRVFKYFGALLVLVSLAGLVFLGSGMIGDQALLKAAVSRDADTKRFQLNKAAKHIMTRDEAREQLAMLDIELGKQTRNKMTFFNGINALYEAFLVRPTSTLIFTLYSNAKAAQLDPLLNAIAPYLRMRNGVFTNDPDPEPSSGEKK